MLRLEIMPLVPDFGESLSSLLGQVNPKTRLMFTRDFRIFEQFANFPGAVNKTPTNVIKTSLLPGDLTVASVSEENGVTFNRNDEYGEISWVHGKELKTLHIPDDTSPINKAIKAYIDQLPDEIPILLRWE
jgi:hypothetical protein